MLAAKQLYRNVPTAVHSGCTIYTVDVLSRRSGRAATKPASLLSAAENAAKHVVSEYTFLSVFIWTLIWTLSLPGL